LALACNLLCCKKKWKLSLKKSNLKINNDFLDKEEKS